MKYTVFLSIFSNYGPFLTLFSACDNLLILIGALVSFKPWTSFTQFSSTFLYICNFLLWSLEISQESTDTHIITYWDILLCWFLNFLGMISKVSVLISPKPDFPSWSPFHMIALINILFSLFSHSKLLREWLLLLPLADTSMSKSLS